MKSMTYGELPSEEDFNAAWDKLLSENELRGEVFHFGNCPRMGTVALTQSELWEEIMLAHQEYETGKADDSGDWLSAVLDCLGFEWIL